ncbi:hypothetical protein [Burkholderia sp. S171]|uniref:hypothetical protein n=1 Tax=Burkholderia sp. S171 TaxID=1641860 RepID=UPI00131D1128|nr:hypothetical protein [Burkholderia sp. S171]
MLTEIEDMEVSFEGRYRSRDRRLASVQGTALGVLKLIQRAREFEEVDDNIRCAAYWLRLAATELDELLKARKD